LLFEQDRDQVGLLTPIFHKESKTGNWFVFSKLGALILTVDSKKKLSEFHKMAGLVFDRALVTSWRIRLRIR
jgi:hypothetical protein